MLRIEVKQEITLQETRLQIERPDHPHFFIYCQQDLQRAVAEILSLEHRQGRGNADTIIGAQGRAPGPDPAIVDIGLD